MIGTDSLVQAETTQSASGKSSRKRGEFYLEIVIFEVRRVIKAPSPYLSHSWLSRSMVYSTVCRDMASNSFPNQCSGMSSPFPRETLLSKDRVMIIPLC